MPPSIKPQPRGHLPTPSGPLGDVIEPRVTDWLSGHLPWLTGPLQISRLTGGRSNLTYRVADVVGQKVILRRPPFGNSVGGAHDVLREAAVLTGLHGSVPVPRVLARCDDREVSPSAFIVMEFLDGTVLRTREDVINSVPPAARRTIGPALIDSAIMLHAVDPASAGLGQIAVRNDYVPRQLRRWHSNTHRIAVRSVPDLDNAHQILSSAIPTQRRRAIVHGDFRLDNCLLTTDLRRVAGILDWELATVGDPLADVGQLLTYWAEPDDIGTALHNPPTLEPGFSSRAELAERYCGATDSDPRELEYFVAFNWWKTACILENVYARLCIGRISFEDRDAESFGRQASTVARLAVDHARRIATR